MAIWRDEAKDGNLVADLRVGATMEEAKVMVDALNNRDKYQKLLGFVKEIAKEKDEGCYESSAAGLSIIISRATDILEEIGELDG